jgi:hypothetical protein
VMFVGFSGYPGFHREPCIYDDDCGSKMRRDPCSCYFMEVCQASFLKAAQWKGAKISNMRSGELIMPNLEAVV